MLNIIWYIIVGFLAGLIARALLPGGDQMGFLATTAVGIVGSVIGGYIGGRMKPAAAGSSFQRTGFIMSIVGAVLLLIIIRLIR